jgi:hypothetical protein
VSLAARAAGAFAVRTGAVLTLHTTRAAGAGLASLLTAALASLRRAALADRITGNSSLVDRTTLASLTLSLTNKLAQIRAEHHAGHADAQTDNQRTKQTKKRLHVFLS